MVANSLRDLGWKMFWDETCTNEVKSGDTLPVEAGKELNFYYACVPDKVNSDGTVDKYDVNTEYPIMYGLTEINEDNNIIEIGGINSPMTSMIGQIEEVAVFTGNDIDINKLINYNISQKTLYSDNSNDEPVYGSKEEAIQNNVSAFYYFNEKEKLYKNSLSGKGEIIVYGDGNLVDGENRNAIQLSDDKDRLEIQPMRLGYDFAISTRFEVTTSGYFVLLKVKGVFKLEYDYNNRIFNLFIMDNFKDEYVEYKTESISEIFGKTNDLSIAIINNNVKVLLNGDIILDEKITFVLGGINSYLNGDYICSTKTIAYKNNSPSYWISDAVYKVRDIYNNTTVIERNIFNSNGYMSFPIIGKINIYKKDTNSIDNANINIDYHRSTYTNYLRYLNKDDVLIREDFGMYDHKVLYCNLKSDKVINLKFQIRDDISEIKGNISPYIYNIVASKVTLTKHRVSI